MKTIRYGSRGKEVYFLEEILARWGYKVFVSEYFGKDTHQAVLDFQQKNNLVVDGIVGVKTWSKIIAKEQQITDYNNKLLSEKDIVNFADTFDLEIALVKAVNELESNGKGFLLSGKPRILFEGHVFWRELEKRHMDPHDYENEKTKDILYPRWSRKYYKGGEQEYKRLEKAAGLSTLPAFKAAAYSSASWGSFQIMGFHYSFLGYNTVTEFVEIMYKHEREHLNAFGKFIKQTKFKGESLLFWLKHKDWKLFAEGYNGIGYKKNKYDQKLQRAYNRYIKLTD